MDVWDCALRFMDSQILFTATELRVFDHLDEQALDARSLADRIQLGAETTQRLLTALCSLGLVQRNGSGYVNSAEAHAQLVSSRPGYIGGLFHHLRKDLYPLWQQLPHALAEEQAQWARAFPHTSAPTESMYDDPAALARFMDGMHAITYDAGRQFAGLVPELQAVRTIVDVGGASGAFLIALAEQHAQLHGIVYDLPPVRPIAERYIAAAEMSDRLRFAPGDFWRDPLPERRDAYALGFILHDWDTRGGDILLDRIASAAGKGALLIVGEYVLNDERTGPHHVARQDLNMLIAARGRERTAREYSEWLARHGFATTRIQSTQYGKTFLVTRLQRPPALMRPAATARGRAPAVRVPG